VGETARSVKQKVVDLVERGYRKVRSRVLRWLKSLNTTKPSGPPDPNAVPGGTRTRISPDDKDAENIRALTRENETADLLAQAGYKTTQNPRDLTPRDQVKPGKTPDYRVEGKIFDCYAPSKKKSTRGVHSYVEAKIKDGQTRRVVINLEDWGGDVAELRKQFNDWPITKLDEVLIVTKSKSIERLWP